MSRRVAERRLRRQIRGASDDARRLAAARPLEDARDAQVAHRDAQVRVDEEVRRLQIAMHRARRVDGVDPEACLVEDAQRLLDVGRAVAALEPLLDGGSVDVLHDEVRRALVLAERVHREDVRVRDARHGAGLDGEELAQVLVSEELGTNELDGDIAIEAVVVGERHDPHSAGAERTHDAIRVGDHGPAREPQLAHDRDARAGIGLDWHLAAARRDLDLDAIEGRLVEAGDAVGARLVAMRRLLHAGDAVARRGAVLVRGLGRRHGGVLVRCGDAAYHQSSNAPRCHEPVE